MSLGPQKHAELMFYGQSIVQKVPELIAINVVFSWTSVHGGGGIQVTPSGEEDCTLS